MIYLEIFEKLTKEEKLSRRPQTVRIKVDSKEEALALLPNYEALFTGLNYTKRLHTCNHPNEGCTVEEL